MDVEDLLGVFLDKKRCQKPHVPGQDDKIDLRFLEIDHDVAVIALRGDVILALQAQRFDTGGCSALEGEGLVVIGENQSQFGFDRALFYGVDDGLQIGTITGDKNSETHD